MRPPEFTGGNLDFGPTQPRGNCFNEAAGIHRRKPAAIRFAPLGGYRFNEAAGIHRRKLADPEREE